jgi:hypothetical protein
MSPATVTGFPRKGIRFRPFATVRPAVREFCWCMLFHMAAHKLRPFRIDNGEQYAGPHRYSRKLALAIRNMRFTPAVVPREEVDGARFRDAASSSDSPSPPS